MADVQDFISKFNPSYSSCHSIEDSGLFYTLKKEDITIYLTHYLEAIDEEDECIVIVFKGDIKQPSFAGFIKDAWVYLIDNLINA